MQLIGHGDGRGQKRDWESKFLSLSNIKVFFSNGFISSQGDVFFSLKSDKAATVNDALFPKKKLYLGLISISRVNKMGTLLQLS